MKQHTDIGKALNLVLTETGDLYPCAFLQETPFLAGNVRESSLKDLWDKAPVFRMFRNLDVKSCLTCYRFETCRGGCPAMAYGVWRRCPCPIGRTIIRTSFRVASSRELQ